MNKGTEEIKSDALSAMQDFWPNGGREWDAIGALYDAIATGKIPGVQVVTLATAREEMVDYIKAAIGEGYQPEHKAAIRDLVVIELLDDHSLNRKYGKCWQWYNMGGGIHETFQQQGKHDHACTNCFADQGPCLGECAVSGEKSQRQKGFEEAARPLIKWLAENVNPHSTVVVDCTGAVLYSAEKSFQTEDYLKD